MEQNGLGEDDGIRKRIFPPSNSLINRMQIRMGMTVEGMGMRG